VYWCCRNKNLFLIFFPFVLAACASVSLPAKKPKDIYCPMNTDSERVKPLDAMPVSATEAVLVCGHREDTRAAKRMRVSETEIIRYNIENDKHVSVWSTGSLDVRYVQLIPTKKQIEVLWPVFDKEGKPTPVLRELYNCAGAACTLAEKRSVFKKDDPAYISALPNVKDLKKWLQEEDSVDRATILFLAAAAGEKKSLNVIRDRALPKLSQDGYFEKTMAYYNQLLDEMQKLSLQ
jgi:hypothetical protein